MKNLALVLTALLLATACRPHRVGSEQELARHSADLWTRVGQALADELKAAGITQGRVLLVRASAKALVAEQHDAMAAALAAAAGGLQFAPAAVADLPRPPGLDESFPVQPAPATRKWIADQLARQPGTVAVVNLVGAPDPREPALPVPHFCFAPAAGPELKDLLKSGAVKAAIAGAHQVPPGERDWFKVRFAVLRADNADAW